MPSDHFVGIDVSEAPMTGQEFAAELSGVEVADSSREGT